MVNMEGEDQEYNIFWREAAALAPNVKWLQGCNRHEARAGWH
jgi:hypothetical protein